MEVNTPHNESYWFVVREDQNNVVLSRFSGNNFAIQSPQIPGPEARYILEPSVNQQYTPVSIPSEDVPKTYAKESTANKDGENFWDRNKVKLFLSLCLNDSFRDETKSRPLWNEIALHIGTTPEECDKKYRNLRRTFLRLLKKKRLGKGIKWVHYHACEEVFKDCKTMSPAILEPWEDSKIRRLLTLYIENINRFRSSEWLQKDVWKEIAIQLHTTEYNCYHKFKNLKRTYFNYVEKGNESGKIKWPYHHYFERIFYNYQPGEKPWSRNKVKVLISAYTEIAEKFKSTKYQKKELWKEVARKVGEPAGSCDKKFRNLKQTYLRLRRKAISGRCITKWRYYNDFVNLYENEHSALNIPTDEVFKPVEEDYVKHLLRFYIENKKKFRDPLVKKKNLWKQIAPKIGYSPEECDKKFRNLKHTYLRLAEKKSATGKAVTWPYFSDFEEIYGEPNSARMQVKQECNVDNAMLSEIRNIVHTATDSNDRDKFDKLVKAVEESNNIQRERNRILQLMLDRMPN
ncbi:uncharacterized protein LOC121737901 [Aricia agestis]|uniref:uncharacterized protein LOC121737901 n=1 Tax=Aricia agestis TaxID=91739 RepID=UPI001C20A2A4|nr:uncharacterized protein LOC121737901 [Aricia agestis]